MKILFDFEEGMPEDALAELYTGQTKLILKELKDFVYQRVSVLKKEIEQYPEGKIVIHFFDKEIRYYYPYPLSEKLETCISNQDFEYCFQKAWKILYPDTPPPEQNQ